MNERKNESSSACSASGHILSLVNRMRSNLLTLLVLCLLQRIHFGNAFITFQAKTLSSPLVSRHKSSTSVSMVASVPDQPGMVLKDRLVEAGVPPSDIQLRADINSKGSDVETACASTAEVKTLVWEVSCRQNDDEIEDQKFYVVTAKKMADKVDTSLLRDLIHKNNDGDLPFGFTPSRLSMAPIKKAEHMTGFQSGCMPPIGHSVPMKLYIEESITEYDIASIGSGSLGHSLLLPMKELLKVAEKNNQGPQIESFIQSNGRSRSPSSVLETNTHNINGVEKSAQRLRRAGSEPKDRLSEYRSMQSMVAKAKLLRTTARKKGRTEMMKELIDEAVRVGEFPRLMQVSDGDGGLDKNALHLCAWRGDFETVKLLVETSKEHYPELDIVNMFSRGSGNYGKTPIFYALTQCREDVVRYLVSEGANLLFVNNKGQTPCSIAVSHMQDDCCRFLYDTELEQLRNGGVFVNYRDSHSDEKLYGDLDPRFEIDSCNMGDDLILQIDRYKNSLGGGETVHGGFPAKFSPRSLRPTVRWWKREDRSLENANSSNLSGQITFTQPRAKSAKNKENQKEESSQKASLDKLHDKVTPKNLLDIESLEVLTIDQVLDPQSRDSGINTETTILVNCTETIRQLESEIDKTIELAATLASIEGKTADEVLVDTAWGLDCEWLPGFDFGHNNPVATLQLSTQTNSFLIDLQSLCQPLHLKKDEEPALTEIEVNLCNALTKLFSNINVSLVGYGILQDLGKLAGSYPHLTCFSIYNSVIDLQSISNVALPKAEKQNMSSLQKMVATLLHKKLDKTQQCSDWTKRPLTRDQLDYATLDAAVLLKLLKILMEQSTIERYNGQFFTIHAAITTNVRFILLEDDDHLENNFEYEIPYGKVSTMFSRKIARQSWPANQATPDGPRLIMPNSGPTKKERSHLQKVGPPGSKKPKPMQLKDIIGNLDNLPIPGTTLGYTKDSCVERVIGHEFMNTLPERTYIGFNRRSGVCETSNSWIIFCNFGGSGTRATRTGFLQDGRDLLFNLNPQNFHGKSSEKTLLDFVSSPSWVRETSAKKILLFARDGTRNKYTYCGLCECQEIITKECGTVDLLLNLINFSQLENENKISGDFLALVENQNQR